jgi:hypothetical protein
VESASARLRGLFRERPFVYMPAVYHALGGLMAQQAGCDGNRNFKRHFAPPPPERNP